MFGNNKHNVPQQHLDGAAAVRRSIDAARRRLERITVSDGHKELADAAAAHAAIAQAQATLLLAEQQREANIRGRVYDMVRIPVWFSVHKGAVKMLLDEATIANPIPEDELTLERLVSGLRPGVRELFESALFPESGSAVPVNLQEVPSPWDVEPK